MQCVILAGGLGTRMKAFTETLPKSLLPVGSHPFLKYQLDWLANNGVTHVIMCLGYKGQMIRDYAGDGSAWNLSIQYTDESDQLLGTGGALRLAFDQGYLEPNFQVIYGDSYLPVDLKKIWHRFSQRTEAALMTVIRNNDQWDKSNACFDGEKVPLYDKTLGSEKPKSMEFIDYGLSVFRRLTIEREIPSRQRVDLADVLHRLSVAGDLAGFEIHRRFFEIGSPAGLSDFKQYIDKTLKGEKS